MTLDAVSSGRLKLLRFPLMVAIVFSHAALSVRPAEGNVAGVARFFDFLMTHGLMRMSVCCFFLISGYLFFLKFDGSPQNYLRKLSSRCRTLLVPLLFWSNLVLLVFFIFQSLPATKPLFTGNRALVSEFGIFDYLDALIGIRYHPFALQFWFIRDLLIFTVLSPLIYFLVKRIPLLTGVALAWCYFTGIWPLNFGNFLPLGIPELHSTVFFTLGAWCAVSGRSIFFMDKVGVEAAVLFCAALLSQFFLKTEGFISGIPWIGMAAGILTFLWLSGKIAQYEKVRRLLFVAAPRSFFLFAAHEPLMSFLARVVRRNFYIGPGLPMLAFSTILPVFVIALVLFAYEVLARNTPRVLGYVTGGRRV
jgi:surface polysaccharide O-acyltransferase-like enzyme